MEFNGSHSKKRKTKDYWTYLEDNYREVASWPTWMRGETGPSSEEAQATSEGNDDEEECDPNLAD